MLADENSGNVKVEDLRNRVKLIEDVNPIMTISIHQNSFPDGSVSGPQVFFFDQSKEGEKLAATIQAVLNEQLNPPKQRVSKSNNDYYILKKTPTPTVIVECGFLSNETEAANLTDDAYQDKLARAIYSGVMQYLEESDSSEPDSSVSDSTESAISSEIPESTE